MRRIAARWAGPAAREEIARTIRFAIVGVSVAVLYAGGFAVLRAAGLAPWAASALAFAVAVSWQYLAQSVWTFRARARDRGQAVRFAATIGLGFCVSTAITGLAGPLAGLPDWVAVAIVIVWLPVQNYLVFRFWVFRHSFAAAGAERLAR